MRLAGGAALAAVMITLAGCQPTQEAAPAQSLDLEWVAQQSGVNSSLRGLAVVNAEDIQDGLMIIPGNRCGEGEVGEREVRGGGGGGETG